MPGNQSFPDRFEHRLPVGRRLLFVDVDSSGSSSRGSPREHQVVTEDSQSDVRDETPGMVGPVNDYLVVFEIRFLPPARVWVIGFAARFSSGGRHRV